eukprot:gene11323-15187_t
MHSSISTLRNQNGIISYSVKSNSDYASWLLSASNPISSKIQLVFNEISILQAQLIIYDSSTIDSSKILFICTSCGSLIPPPFYSTSNSVVIVISGVTGVSFVSSYFNLQYLNIPQSLNSQSSLFNYMSIKLNMGYAKIIPYQINDRYIPAYSSQSWNISASSVNSNSKTRIMFSFSNFSFDDDNSNSNLLKNQLCQSRLLIYDQFDSTGNLLFSGCSSADMPSNWLYSNTGVARVVFLSGNKMLKNTNFQITFYEDVDKYKCGSFLSPDYLIDQSMVITDGSKSSNLMKTGMNCQWIISPLKMESSNSVTVNFILNWVSMKYGSAITVYDGDQPSGTILWKCVGASRTVPPIITSTKNSLYVTYTSDSSNPVVYYGFSGEYYSNYIGSVGSGRGYTVLSMSSSLGIYPPGDGNNNQTQNISYTWYVQPTSYNNKIIFSFSRFELWNPSDELIIYDGSNSESAVIGRFNGGDTLPLDWFIASSATAMIVYNSNIDKTQPSTLKTKTTGTFQLAYFTDGPNYHCGFTTNPGIITSASFTITDGSYSTENIYSSQNCRWIIKPSKAIKIFVFFNRMSLTNAQLSFYAGDSSASKNLLLAVSDTSAVPSPLTFDNSIITVIYTSADSNANGYGFSFTYYGIFDEWSFPGDRIVWLRSSTLYSLLMNPLDSTKTSSQLITNNIQSAKNLTWYISPVQTLSPLYFMFSSITFLNPVSRCKNQSNNSTLTCSNMQISIYDGNQPLESNKIFEFDCNATRCSNKNLYVWFKASSSNAVILFRHFQSIISKQKINRALNSSSDGNTNYDNNINFEVSYFSDGSNFRCGIPSNPAILTAPSMVLTDGSKSTDRMDGGLNCIWIIQPTDIPSSNNNNNDNNAINRTTIIEFLLMDLNGGSIEVYDGPSSNSPLLWACYDCSELPYPIISYSNSIIVKFSTKSSIGSGNYGYGFRAIYWSIFNTTWKETGLGTSLEMPVGFSMDNDIYNNHSAYFLLAKASNVTKKLAYYPDYYSDVNERAQRIVNNDAVDGRSDDAIFESSESNGYMCGSIVNLGYNLNNYDFNSFDNDDDLGMIIENGSVDNNNTNYLISPNSIIYKLTQSLGSYIQSHTEYKTLLRVMGIHQSDSIHNIANSHSHHVKQLDDLIKQNHRKIIKDSISSSPFAPATTCKYMIDSGSSQAIRIDLAHFDSSTNGRLRIFGGLLENDAVLFDSSRSHSNYQNASLIAPCGKSIILLELNNSISAKSIASSLPKYEMTLFYTIITSDKGKICLDYAASLLPIEKKTDPMIVYYISFGVVGGIAIIIALLYYLRQYIAANGYVFYPHRPKRGNSSSSFTSLLSPHRVAIANENGNNDSNDGFKIKRSRTFQTASHSHPRYTPFLDSLVMKFLINQRGTCCICSSTNIAVFDLQCSHSICIDCMKSYLESALGNISMFPVKCPMFYVRCTTTIDAKIAKKVLNESQYNRFTEFSDRAMFGDGMRCIFCHNYVIYPNNMSNNFSRVECPYCIQLFCIRCKKPWHKNGRCPIEYIDDSLEKWKEKSGAQTCPGCRKLIEKDDPDTCNHMVHKITDSIPCIRDRTDFCYLCGEEVTGDYPHQEVKNGRITTINHFPDGVFQDCRFIKQKQREAELEKQKKAKRLQSKLNNRRVDNNRNAAGHIEWMSQSTTGSSIGNTQSLVNVRNNNVIIAPSRPANNRNNNTPQHVTHTRDDRKDNDNEDDHFDEEWNIALALSLSNSNSNDGRVRTFGSSSNERIELMAPFINQSTSSNNNDSNRIITTIHNNYAHDPMIISDSALTMVRRIQANGTSSRLSVSSVVSEGSINDNIQANSSNTHPNNNNYINVRNLPITTAQRYSIARIERGSLESIGSIESSERLTVIPVRIANNRTNNHNNSSNAIRNNNNNNNNRNRYIGSINETQSPSSSPNRNRGR